MQLRKPQREATDAVLKRFSAGINRQVIQLPTGCHAKGQGILLHTGEILPVEDVVVGDRLMGPDSEPRTVISLVRGRGRMCRIVPVKGQPFIVNEDHILTLVRTNDGSKHAGRLIDISVKEYLSTNGTFKHSHKLIRRGVEWFSGQSFDLPLQPYFMGVMLGDGYLKDGRISKPEPHIMIACVKQAEALGAGFAWGEHKGSVDTYRVVRSGTFTNPVTAVLRELNLDDCTSGTKFIPFIYKTAPVQDRLDLLAGLLDTDGSRAGLNGFDYVSKSPHLANDVAFVARSLGFAAYVKSCTKSCQGGFSGTYFRVSISGDTETIPCKAVRKQAEVRRQKKSVLRTGFSVEMLGEDDYYGFTLTGDGRFLLDDFTITHNCGKTPILADLPNNMQFAPDDWMLLLAPREELVAQAYNTFKDWNPGRSVGIEMATERAGNASLVVATPQTLGRKDTNRLAPFLNRKKPRVIAVDEAHLVIGETYGRIFKAFDVANDTSILSLGVTATVNRADERGLNEVYQEISYRMSILDAIKQGWVTDFRGISVRSAVDLEDVGSSKGDFNTADLSGRVNTDARNDLVVRAWLKYGANAQSIVFAVDIEHSKSLALKFREYGVAAEAVWGDDPDRTEKLTFHKAGHLKVLVNCEVLTTGYDDRNISCIVLARPTQSELLYTQMIGRGGRLPHGIDNLVEAQAAGKEVKKTSCLIIDTVDNTKKHSLVTLPSLFGLNSGMDLKGRPITKVMQEVEEIKAQRPLVDISKADDVAKLKEYAETVDLFRVSYPPEILQLSEYQWRRIGNDYILMLTGGECLVITEDMIGNYEVHGTVNGCVVEEQTQTLEDAITEADRWVTIHGGRTLCSLVKRHTKWHDKPPTPDQLATCAKFKIVVPDGATKGEVHQVINQKLLEFMQRRKNRVA